MRIETTTESGREITVESIEDSSKFALSGPGLPGVVEVGFASFTGQLKGKVKMGGKQRNLIVGLRPEDTKTIGSYVSRKYRDMDRADNARRYPAKLAEAKDSGKRVQVKVELDDNMRPNRYYITPDGDLEVRVEDAH